MNYLKITILFTSILFMANCNPKEEIAPENPCGNHVQPNADFVFEAGTGEVLPNNEYGFIYNNFEPKDTIAGFYKNQFRSEFTDTNIYKHTWYIGKDIIHDYKAWKDFYSVPRPANISIQHVMKWKPNKLCNPNDKGYDSVNFTFNIPAYYNDYLSYRSKYRMVYDSIGANNKDSFDIMFYWSPNGNNKDSILENPKTKYIDTKYSELRVKGFLLSDDGFKTSFGSQYYDLYSPIISNTLLIGNYNGGNPFGDLRLIINKQLVTLTYYNRPKRYFLKGRILN